MARIGCFVLAGRQNSSRVRQELFDERRTHSIIGAFFEVYNTLGYGFVEHLYVSAMERERRDRGHAVAREVLVRVMYKGNELGLQRLDLIVDEKIVVETKASRELHGSAGRQLYNYLRATNLRVGLLLHFGPHPRFYRVISRPEKSDPTHLRKSDASV